MPPDKHSITRVTRLHRSPFPESLFLTRREREREKEKLRGGHVGNFTFDYYRYRFLEIDQVRI